MRVFFALRTLSMVDCLIRDTFTPTSMIALEILEGHPWEGFFSIGREERPNPTGVGGMNTREQIL